MNSPSVDIASLLESGIGLSLGINLFVSKTPASPDKCVTVTDTGGYSPSTTFNLSETSGNPTIQILVRGSKQNYVEAYLLLEEIRMYLHGRSQEVIGLTKYILILAETDILTLGYDDNNRPLLSCNFLLTRTE